MSTDARTAVLARIRSALGGPAAGANELPAFEVAHAAWEALPRAYLRAAPLSLEEMLDLLEDRLRDYDAEVTRVRERDVAAAIASVLRARGDLPTLLPPGFPRNWLPAMETLVTDEDFSPRQLDRFDGVLTGTVAAIADTGSLVLQNVSGQGRRAATLVPDFHLCVVRAADVVATVPEAFARLAATAELPTTFVSGPSATADIEMTRIKGVHGPRFLHVLLVVEEVPATEETFSV